ncbi:hypothetical protein T492DRAFT_232748 [Pavlovales sp. CCMP2436]|nr:hypothetical protein T492DRAFT_232748 [Pavlovales sp. CCMP2436]
MAGSAEVIDLEAPAAGGSSATKVAGRDADGAIDLDAAGDAVEGAGAAGSALKPIILDDSKRRAQGGGSEAKRPRLGALGVPEPGTHRGPFAFYLLRTAAEEHLSPRPPFTVSFEELTRGTWTWVIYSNYLIDDRWLTTACPSLTKCPIVVLAPEGLKLPNLCAKNPHVHIIAPQLETKWGTHHSKFMLLFSATGVRVIIHTANGLYHDARDLTQVLKYIPLVRPLIK